eukprot:gene10104-13580_t
MMISILIVTSPSPTNPSTYLIDNVIESLELYLPELICCPIFILLDGYNIINSNSINCEEQTLDAKTEETDLKWKIVNNEDTKTSSVGNIMDKNDEETCYNVDNAYITDNMFPQNRESNSIDSYHIKNHTKIGKISSSLAMDYEQYYLNLKSKYSNYHDVNTKRQYHIFRADSHKGFAMMVKFGLELSQQLYSNCLYALICQHDRIFSHHFHHFHTLINTMNHNNSIRYIGFPSITNFQHDLVLSTRYQLHVLNENKINLTINIENENNDNDSLCLQPLIFWFDSQHLCHIERYLEIFKPFRNFPNDLKEILGGNKYLKSMLLKNGDFIEDRFGQVQRNSFIFLKENNYNNEIIIKLFKWYGSYLCWQYDNKQSAKCDIIENSSYSKGSDRYEPIIFVQHLRGRQYNPQFGLDKIENERNNRNKS